MVVELEEYRLLHVEVVFGTLSSDPVLPVNKIDPEIYER